jgi:hypothetical protein
MYLANARLLCGVPIFKSCDIATVFTIPEIVDDFFVNYKYLLRNRYEK